MKACLFCPRTGGSRETRRSTPASARASRSASPGSSAIRPASARCCATSAAISARRTGGTPRPARRSSSSRRQLCMIEPGDTVDRGDEVLPPAALGREDLAPRGRQPVVAAAPLAGLLDPLAPDPAALLEPVQQRIEGRNAEAQRAAGAVLDQLADLVAMPRAGLDERQDQQLG